MILTGSLEEVIKEIKDDESFIGIVVEEKIGLLLSNEPDEEVEKVTTEEEEKWETTIYENVKGLLPSRKLEEVVIETGDDNSCVAFVL